MENKYELIEQIEKYLSGEMNGVEMKAFEKIIFTNPPLAQELASHKKLMQAFGHHADRKNIKLILDRAHDKMQAQVDTTSIRSVKTRSFIFGKKELGIAASIALIISIGTYLIMNFVNSFTNKDKAYYKELSIDLERVKTSQDKIIRELNAEKTPIRRPSFGGTAVAISADGFVLTSYHVVKNVDSVYIENKRFNRLKLKRVYVDPVLDLVILKVDDSNFEGFGQLPFTFRKASLDLGERVYTLGYPKADVVFGEGYISSVYGYDGDTTSYQISVPVNPGQSGGPLFDDSGNLVGIVSGKHTENESSAFAVKANYLKKVILANDSLNSAIQLPKVNSLKNQSRIQMIKKMQEYVFEVKAYN